MKLTYFDLRGRAEPIRFILAAGGLEYEDIRVKSEEWGTLKSKTPWGQLPILETDDGLVIAQSITICRYLARQTNLTGSSDLEATKCEEYVDAFNDIVIEWVNFVWEEKDPVKKAEKKETFIASTCPNFLSKLNKIIFQNGGTHLVGKGLTWADIYIGCAVEGFQVTCGSDIINEYPQVVKMCQTVLEHPKIKAWVEKRPHEDLLAITSC